MDEPLCETSVTGKLIEKLLTQSHRLRPEQHLIAVKGVLLPQNGDLTSKSLRVSLQWANESPPELLRSVIVKTVETAAIERMLDRKHMAREKIDQIVKHISRGHNVECDIYELDGLSEAIPMANCYGLMRTTHDGQPGLVVLEDLLLDKGYIKPITIMDDGISKGEMESVWDTLSSLHAWSVEHTEWRRCIPSLNEFNLLAPLVDRMSKEFHKAKSDFPDVFKDLDESTFNERINTRTYRELFGCDPKERYNLPEVLVYGDMHASHMVFEKKKKKPDDNEDGKRNEGRLIALLDWQSAHRGCAAEDLARIFVVCLSMEERKKHSDECIRRYVELYNSKIKSVDNRITYEDMKRATDDMFSFKGIMWSCGMAKMEKIVERLDDEDLSIALCKSVVYKENLDDAMELAKW